MLAIRIIHITIRNKSINAIMPLLAGKDYMDIIQKNVPLQYEGPC